MHLIHIVHLKDCFIHVLDINRIHVYCYNFNFQDEFYVIGHLFDQCDELISLDDVLGYIAPASGSTEQESTHAHKSLSFFKRLTSGNMITSGKKKCTNIVMSIAGGSQYIGQSSIQKGREGLHGRKNEAMRVFLQIKVNWQLVHK